MGECDSMSPMATPDLPLAPDLARVLSFLRDGVPRTRAQLAEESGLARSTLLARLDQLVAGGLVVHSAGNVSSGGRPAGYLVFRPAARLLLAVDLGATHGVVALTDLGGAVLEMESTTLIIADGPELILDWVLAAAERLRVRSGRPVADIVGVGIGLPGPVEHSTGLPTNPPIMPGWDAFDVPAYMRAHYDAPVLVDNDVNLLALGEHATVWRHEDDLLFVKVATGIGAGVISGGRLQRGAQGSAGDLGHVRVPFTSRTPAHGEADADLEALASGPGIARALSAAGTSASSSQDVVELARAGDPRAIDAIRQAGRDLGEVLSTCVNLLNPAVIVIGGSIARSGEHLLAGVREVVYGQSTPLATRHLTITESRAGETGGVLGAAIMLIHHLLGPAA
jgi:predicted NBD/HSP70 family sugar kinase